MIDEILKKIEWNGAEWTPIESSIDQALTAIYEIGLGVIGDNVEEYPYNDSAQYGQRIGYNRAKDELRLAWAKACGVAEK